MQNADGLCSCLFNVYKEVLSHFYTHDHLYTIYFQEQSAMNHCIMNVSFCTPL
jgi:hypothetical protein